MSEEIQSPELPSDPIEFDEIIAAFNPSNKFSVEAHEQAIDRFSIDQKALPLKLESFATSRDPSETGARLLEMLDPNKRIILASVLGDGSTNQLLQALVESDLDNVALLFLPGGSYNNLTASFYDGDENFPDYLIYHGRVEHFRPLQVTVTSPSGRGANHVAASVVGFGASHYGIAAINEEGHRSGITGALRTAHVGKLSVKKAVDGPTLTRAMASAPKFRARLDGKPFNGKDISFLNVPNVASFKAPQVPQHGGFIRVTVESLTELPRILRQLRKGEYPAEEKTFSSFTIDPHDFTFYQVDGESSDQDGTPFLAGPGSTITIGQARSLPVITNLVETQELAS